jgi:hypothetical protein
LKFHLHGIEGEIKRDEEERKKIDEVPGGDKMDDMKDFAEEIKSPYGENENS